jgi:hypothetical protein
MNIQFFAGLPFSLFFLYLAQRQLKAQDRNMSTIVAKMHRDMLKALIMQVIKREKNQINWTFIS